MWHSAGGYFTNAKQLTLDGTQLFTQIQAMWETRTPL
jgi:hypothetical protein